MYAGDSENLHVPVHAVKDLVFADNNASKSKTGTKYTNLKVKSKAFRSTT